MMTGSNNPAEQSSLRELARGVCDDLFQNIIVQEERAAAGDVEAVHDMRVASRRLRVALSNYAVCCVPEMRRDTRARLSRLADALGAVRDLDVMIEALSERKAALLPEQKNYLRALISRLRARRLRRRKHLLDYLGGDDYATFKTDFPRLIQKPVEVHQAEITTTDGEGIQNQESIAG
jgi:CHAD domain-containing protein